MISKLLSLFSSPTEEPKDPHSTEVVDEPVVEIVEAPCEHDWQVIDDSFRGIIKYGTLNWMKGGVNYEPWTSQAFACEGKQFDYKRYEEFPKDRVCLLCGKCDNQLEKAIQEIDERWFREDNQERLDAEERQRREELAEKIWKDCKGG